jgi:hypothetical protein
MKDLGRCVLRAEELKRCKGRRYFMLVFVKVNDVNQDLYPPIPYSVEDLGGASRRILWGVWRPKTGATTTGAGAGQPATGATAGAKPPWAHKRRGSRPKGSKGLRPGRDGVHTFDGEAET